MNYSTDNTRIIDRKKVPAPYELVNKHPIDDQIAKLVYGTRQEISQILHEKDDRLLVVVGPCSIHDPKSAIEYAKKLVEQNIPHLVPLFSTHVHGLIQYAVTYLIRTRRLRETSPVTMEVNRANDISMKWIL